MAEGTGLMGVDVGGTFTDCVAVKDGKILATKVLIDASRREQPVLQGAKELGLDGIGTFNHATTVGLNAVLTRNLPKIGFLTTNGHRDMLDMGRGWRPFEALMNPHWRRSFGDAARPLVPRYLRRGISERITGDGEALVALDEEQAREQLRVLKRCDVAGVAICLLNAYINHAHEERLLELVREELGDVPCSISSAVSPLAKEYARASSTVIDVFMKLIFTEYSNTLESGLKDEGFTGQLNYADCSASLAPVKNAMAAPLRILFSGPAAGTVSSAYFGRLIGEDKLICCDVGGTSCDISLVSGGTPIVNTTFEIEHDLMVNTLAGEIATIGAGGGSIVHVLPNGELAVGPESAGGDPGPACYGRGGTQPTTTDACLLMGILTEDNKLGTLQLSADRAREAFEGLETNLSFEDRVRHSYALALNNIAEGMVDIAVTHGVDPRDYVLVAYGSAGPMFLPPVLDQIHARAVIIPPYPGLFSALGLLSTDLVFGDQRSAYLILDESAAGQIDQVFEQMERNLLASIESDPADLQLRRTFDAQLVGQTWDTPFVDAPAGKIGPEQVREMIGSFHDAYEARWGNRFEAIPVQGVTYRVQAVREAPKVDYSNLAAGLGDPKPDRMIELRYIEDEPIQAGEYQREKLGQGDRVRGPAIIREGTSTIQVAPRQLATVGLYGEIVITREEA